MTSRKPARPALLRHAPTAAVMALLGAACAVTAPPGEAVATESSALGNDIEYCTFASVAGLQLNGNATQVGTTLRMATNTTFQDSSAFRTTTLPLTAATNFFTHVQFVLTPTTSQADGVVFVVQADPRGDTALGGDGGGIAYGNTNGGTAITKSVEVEFDTYANPWDPNANHVGVMVNGDETTHVAVGTPAFTLASSVPIDAWISYTAATTTLQVFVSNTGVKPATPLVTATTVNVFSTVGAAAYFGLTGSTGGSTETEVFNSWILSLTGLSECTCTTNAQCGGSTPACKVSPTPGTCVQCLTNADCSGQTPICNTTTNLCGACTSNASCAGTAGGTTPYCAPTGDPLAGACVGCVTTAECDGTTTTRTPICNKTGAGLDTCRACGSSAECAAAGLELTCLPSGPNSGACAECLTNADCNGKTPVCNTANQCVACVDDASCAAPTPACQTSGALQGECTQCSATNSTACMGATPVCNTATGICIAGCVNDSQCPAADWCDEAVHTCTAKLPNGTAVPSDPTHVNPTLDGACTAAAGALVCVSGVCDTKDNECGYANGDGPCTAGNGATVCRSGTCSGSGVCEPAGGCATDADCTGGNWCDETTGACTPKLANGTSIPVDMPHMNPTLDGECVPDAAMLVCVSGVCDIKDNKCGYANGDGSCTAGNAGTVCRSGACSTNGTCEPMGGCNVNGDCPGGTCNTTTHTCEASTVDAGPPADSGSGEDATAPVDGGSTADASTPDGATADSAAATDGAASSDGASGGGDGGGAGTDAAEASAGYLDGGGLSCDVTASGHDSAPLTGGALGALAVVAATRRRRSKRDRTTSVA